MTSAHLKRFFLLFFAILIVFLPFFSHLALAQTFQPIVNQSSPNSYTAPDTNPDVPKNLHTYTQSVVIEVLSSATCMLAGVDPTDPAKQCLGIDPTTHKIGYVQNGGGALGGMGQLIGMTFNIPVHTSDYFRDIAGNFGITKHAYAAIGEGYGFKSISSLEGVWKAFLNVVYMLFVILFVLIGLAIMFRLKVDPRTVMTLQNQIPKIIVGLLLVTFSFAISGFLIDIMYTSIYLMTNVAAKADNSIAQVGSKIITSTNPFQALDYATGGNGGFPSGLGGLKDIAWKPAQTVGSFVAPAFDSKPGKLIIAVAMGFIGHVLGKGTGELIKSLSTAIGAIVGGTAGLLGVETGPGVVATVAGGAAGGAKIGQMIGNFITNFFTGGAVAVGIFDPKDVAGTFISLIVWLVIVIALLFALFRLWFQLISAYIFILIDIVFAPFWIALGLFPGSQLTFGLWLRDIISNLAAFPTVIVMFYLGRIFINAFGKIPGEAKFVPPMIANPNSENAIGSIIGFGIVLLTPNAVNMAKQALKAPKFDTRPIAQAVGVGTGAVNVPKQATGLGTQLYYLGRVPGIGGLPFGIGKFAQKAAGVPQTPPAGGTPSDYKP